MNETRVDVAIVGGGLVGPSLALALARGGFTVAIVDAEPAETRADPGFDGRAYAVALGSARLLGALGLWQGLEPLAQPIRDIAVTEGTAPAPLLHFDPRQTDEGRVGWILEDRHLRAALYPALAAAGVRHIAPARVTGSTEEPGWRALSLADGTTIRARLAVAADGRRSALAAGAGIGRIGWSYDQTGLVNAIEHELPHEGLAHQGFFPGGPFAVLPLPGNRCSLVWSDRRRQAEAIAALPDDAYTAEIARRIGGRLGAIRLAGRRWAYPLDLTLAHRYVAPRLALVGDAAHGVHPIAGQGFNLGARDVAALAEVLADAARIGEDIGALPVLERYQTWRRFDATLLALGMDALNRLFSTALPPLPMLRQAGLRAVDGLPGLKRAFMREAAGQSGDVPALLRGKLP